VAMAQPSRKQAGADQSHLHVAIHASQTPVGPAAAPRTFVQPAYTPVTTASAATAKPPGRAPPPSV
jgi:hypothetical protein